MLGLKRTCLRVTTTYRLYSTSIAPDVTLRPYQEHCLEACLDALKSGSTRVGVSLPTGSGKTTVFIALLKHINPPPKKPSANRSLIIVNSVELARQTYARAREICPELLVEIEQGPKYVASGKADITVATYQTLLRIERLSKFSPSDYKAIIVDEAHHAAAPSYRRILSQFSSAIYCPERTTQVPELPYHIPILGFSATFSRHDGLALGSVFERIVYHRDFLDMIKEKWLCNVRFTSVKANIDLTGVTLNSRTGDFNPTSLAHVVNTDTVNRLIVKTWFDKAAERKSTLVFCVNLAHVRDLTQEFRQAGVDARYIYSGTPLVERRQLVADFKDGNFPVLVNCAVLTEGVDIPNIDCVVVARPTRSRNVFAQMIGRGMRLSPATGKEDCRIIDFVDSTKRVIGIVSIPTLFGLDLSEIIDDDPLSALEERSAKQIDPSIMEEVGAESNIPEPKSVTYTEYDNPFALVEDSCGAPHIRAISRNAWVGCGDDIYILDCMGKGFIRVDRVGEDKSEIQFRAHYTPASLPIATAMVMKISPYQRSRQILEATSLVEAIRGCDIYFLNQIKDAQIRSGVLCSAKWRKTPATESQKDFILRRWAARATKTVRARAQKDGVTLKRRRRMNGIIGEEQRQQLEGLTKGEAANMIIRIKHGALTRYEKKVNEQEKAMKLLAKEQQRIERLQRQIVKVGPLAANYK